MLCVLGQAITGSLGGNAMVWHFRLGHGVLTLLLFRLVWGLVGGRWSRFGAFIFAPRSVVNYLRGQGKPEHGIGHTPVGAVSVFAMLGFLLAQAGTGLISDGEIAFSGPLTRFVSNATVSLASSYHINVGKWVLLALVLMHLGAVTFYLRRQRTLVAAMLHGDKTLERVALPSRDAAASRTAALFSDRIIHAQICRRQTQVRCSLAFGALNRSQQWSFVWSDWGVRALRAKAHASARCAARRAASRKQSLPPGTGTTSGSRPWRQALKP